MSSYTYVCFIALIAVLLDFINVKITKKVESTISITLVGIVASLIIITIGTLDLFPDSIKAIHDLLVEIDFKAFLLQGILGFLLFAGALGINLTVLKSQKYEIFTFAIIGTLLSTFLIGGILYVVTYYLLNFYIPFILCLLFGAIISPTDPIAVLAIIKKLHAPPRLSMRVEGESLFNDGVGIVIYTTILFVATGDGVSGLEITGLFLIEAVGGITYGLMLGIAAHYLIKYSKNMELLICLLIPTAGYQIAIVIGVSGPLAMVSSGIFVGNITYNILFNESKRNFMHNFWEVIDRFFNSILFLLIGLAMLLITFSSQGLVLMILAVPICLLGRYISVLIPLKSLELIKKKRYNPYTLFIMTWGGLRGGLAFALALSVPRGQFVFRGVDVYDLFILMTYSVVIFAIIVQGTTIERSINKSISISRERIPVNNPDDH